MNVLISDETDKVSESFSEEIRCTLKVMMENLGLSPDSEVSILFTDDKKMRELNKMYRSLDRTTDVLSFPQEEEEILGDIVISVDAAFRQAKTYNLSFEEELFRLIIHGLLHLIGYDHKTKKQREEMRSKEQQLFKVVSDLGVFRRL